jgi:hypothetical protein
MVASQRTLNDSRDDTSIEHEGYFEHMPRKRERERERASERERERERERESLREGEREQAPQCHCDVEPSSLKLATTSGKESRLMSAMATEAWETRLIEPEKIICGALTNRSPSLSSPLFSNQTTVHTTSTAHQRR